MRYRCDKGMDKHAYTRLYETLFHGFREDQLKFVELGLQIGGPEHHRDACRETTDLPSVRMWLDYFPKAQIIGADVSDFSWFQHERFQFVPCDMDDRKNFQALKVATENARVIIDDASHASAHQQFGLLELFPALSEQGLYIIEELQWQPKSYEDKHRHYPKTARLFRNYLRDGFFTHPVRDVEDQLNAIAADFASVFLFQQNYHPAAIAKVAVIHKK